MKMVEKCDDKFILRSSPVQLNEVLLELVEQLAEVVLLLAFLI